LIAVDGLTDPQNLGAIVRSDEALGAHGLVLPQRRNAGLTGSVAKVAAGALEHLPVARVVNLNRSLDALKQEGYRVIGLAAEGTVTLEEAELSGPLVLVTGSEADGLSLLTRRSCDQLVRIPLRGTTPSLNASVATALLLYEVARRSWMAGLRGTAPAPRLERPALPEPVAEVVAAEPELDVVSAEPEAASVGGEAAAQGTDQGHGPPALDAVQEAGREAADAQSQSPGSSALSEPMSLGEPVALGELSDTDHPPTLSSANLSSANQPSANQPAPSQHPSPWLQSSSPAPEAMLEREASALSDAADSGAADSDAVDSRAADSNAADSGAADTGSVSSLLPPRGGENAVASEAGIAQEPRLAEAAPRESPSDAPQRDPLTADASPTDATPAEATASEATASEATASEAPASEALASDVLTPAASSRGSLTVLEDPAAAAAAKSGDPSLQRGVPAASTPPFDDVEATPVASAIAGPFSAALASPGTGTAPSPRSAAPGPAGQEESVGPTPEVASAVDQDVSL
ncbi:MAG: TrmH family RNA methyltransferase, partial [Synechococcaceae cyanobacterium]